jgi:hypothetical protein
VIHDIPSSAMRINGNDHLIEYNEMYRVVYESSDQGAIDMWGDPTYRGNIIRYNYFHDVGPLDEHGTGGKHGRAGVRLDDAISGTFVHSNIFKKASYGNFGAIQINGGKDNVIWNNIIYQCNKAITVVPWSLEGWHKFLTRPLIEILQAGEEVEALYKKAYPDMVRLRSDNICVNSFIENIYIECDQIYGLVDPKRGPVPNNIKERNIEVPNGSAKEINLEKNGYGYKIISEMIGDTVVFDPIPFNKIGLREKELRSMFILK